jgi:short-subunit dehydrogenase
MSTRQIEGCRTILTGASSGIGRALARELGACGAKLVLVARREIELRQLATELESNGTPCDVVVGDITDAAVRKQAVEEARLRFGGLDALINNAGIGALGRFEDASTDRLRRIMEVNFFAAAELIREALPLLKQGHSPLIVNVGSILGHRGIPRSSEYCASKFALQGLSESLRSELAASGIDLLVVSPGTTATDFFDHAMGGGSSPWPAQKGVPAALVASRTVRAMRRGQHEIIVNSRGKLLVLANRLFPRLVDHFMERYG